MRLHFPNPNIIFGSYKMVVCVLILFALAYLHPLCIEGWFGLDWVRVQNLFGKNLSRNDKQYSKGFMKFGCPEPEPEQF